MAQALRLARRSYGQTSPNPLVGAVLVRNGKVIGQGWHRRAGEPHAEIEAIRNAQRRGFRISGATLYVTLEPCCTHGRTPPCTSAILEAGIKRVVVGATDPNPKHRGKGLQILEDAGVRVLAGVRAEECERLNPAFNHWIVDRTPFVTVKAAMSMDGKIATASGESKWITGDKARAFAMKLRQGSDAIMVGINTVLLDDPSLTIRPPGKPKPLRRIVLDPRARTPLSAKVISDDLAGLTTVVVATGAVKSKVSALAKKVRVIVAPLVAGKIDLRWLMKMLGRENVASLLVEGGGETNALFFENGLAHRVTFFYAPKIIGGRDARDGVAGEGFRTLDEAVFLRDVQWTRLGDDLLLAAHVGTEQSARA